MLDFTRALAGPFCTRLLADAGAQVIKIEPPGTGDLSRGLPPVVDAFLSGPYAQQNSGKLSVCLDLTKPMAKRIILELAAASDVVVENFRPGVMARLGIGPVQLQAVNPRLVFLSISGWGQNSGWISRPGNDVVAQCVSGVASLNGDADRAPVVPDMAYVDSHTGLLAYSLLCAALFRRTITGRGEILDISLLDCALQYHDSALQEELAGVSRGSRRSSASHRALVPRGVFACTDGHVAISAFLDENWRRLAGAVGFPLSSDDERYATLASRVARRSEVLDAVGGWCAERTAGIVESELTAQLVPAARVLSVGEAVNIAISSGRPSLTLQSYPTLGKVVRQVDTAGIFAGGAALRRGPSRLGADAPEVLGAILGWTSATFREALTEGALDGEPEVVAELWTWSAEEDLIASPRGARR